MLEIVKTLNSELVDAKKYLDEYENTPNSEFLKSHKLKLIEQENSTIVELEKELNNMIMNIVFTVN